MKLKSCGARDASGTYLAYISIATIEARAKKESGPVVKIARVAVPARMASSNTAVVVEDPRVWGIAKIFPHAFVPESSCLRSMISPVCQSYPPQSERGSELARAGPFALPGIIGRPVSSMVSIRCCRERHGLPLRNLRNPPEIQKRSFCQAGRGNNTQILLNLS